MISWLRALFTRKHFRVQITPECIRVHPKDLDKKIKNIKDTSMQLFKEAYQTQEKIKKEREGGSHKR